MCLDTQLHAILHFLCVVSVMVLLFYGRGQIPWAQRCWSRRRVAMSGLCLAHSPSCAHVWLQNGGVEWSTGVGKGRGRPWAVQLCSLAVLTTTLDGVLQSFTYCVGCHSEPTSSTADAHLPGTHSIPWVFHHNLSASHIYSNVVCQQFCREIKWEYKCETSFLACGRTLLVSGQLTGSQTLFLCPIQWCIKDIALSFAWHLDMPCKHPLPFPFGTIPGG